MSSDPKTLKVLLTGAAGQIGYSICYMIGRGNAFGKNFNVHLVMLDLPVCEGLMNGLRLELEDCAFKHLVKIDVCTNEEEAFKGIDVAILVAGAVNLTKGMQRSELLSANRAIYERQAGYLDKHANKDVKVIVVANPANTNCVILAETCKKISKENFTSLSKLDHNRAVAMIGRKVGVCPSKVKKVIIWGNHSSSMVPDPSHAEIHDGGSVKKVVGTLNNGPWLKDCFVPDVKERSAAVIAQRNKSSALSAAKATCDHLSLWFNGTPVDDWACIGVYSDGSYGIPKGIMYSFPCTSKNGKWSIVQGLEISEETKKEMLASADELVKEKQLALS